MKWKKKKKNLTLLRNADVWLLYHFLCLFFPLSLIVFLYNFGLKFLTANYIYTFESAVLLIEVWLNQKNKRNAAGIVLKIQKRTKLHHYTNCDVEQETRSYDMYNVNVIENGESIQSSLSAVQDITRYVKVCSYSFELTLVKRRRRSLWRFYDF